jgi:hypothetical protein
MRLILWSKEFGKLIVTQISKKLSAVFLTVLSAPGHLAMPFINAFFEALRPNAGCGLLIL